MAAINNMSMGALSLINEETASEVCEKLKSKYGEEFVVTHIGDRFGTSTAKTYVHPVNNYDIVFTARIDISGNITDDYINRIVMNSIEKNMVSHFSANEVTVLANAVVTNCDVFETNRDIDANSFAKNNNLASILVYVVINHNDEDADVIISTLESVSADYNFDLVVCPYFVDHDSFEKCINDFETYPSVGAHLKKYSPLFSSVNIILSNGKSLMTTDELKTIMEGE